MSDHDPNRIDPARPRVDEPLRPVGSGFNWSWVIGGIAAIVVLIVALSFMGRDDRTADTGQPAATTGQAIPQAPRVETSPAPAATPNIVAPAERTPPPPPPANQ